MQGIFDDNGHYLNANVISPPKGPILYGTSTTKNIFRGKNVTTVERFTDGRTTGSIHWTEGKLEVCGKAAKKGGISRSARQWNWKGQSYEVQYQEKEWTATTTKYPLSHVARFRPYIPNLIGKSGVATIYIPRSTPEEEMFFALLLLYSETRRIDYQERKAKEYSTTLSRSKRWWLNWSSIILVRVRHIWSQI